MQHSTRKTRRSRRHRREEGAVLFVVLMVVALSSLAASFAVQDSTYALKGTHGVRQAVTSRYVAESGINTAPGTGTGSALLTLMTGSATLLRENPSGYPSSKFNIPPISSKTKSFWLVNMDDVHEMAFNALDDEIAPILQDGRSPYTSRYEAIYEGKCSADGKLHLSVSVYGRQTMAWSAADEEYTSSSSIPQQKDDANPYHDTVSLARSFYVQQHAGCD